MASVIKPVGGKIVDKCTTPATSPQAAAYPIVSYRLLVRRNAAHDASRHGVNPVPAMDAADAEYRATRGNRFAARRAAFVTVDLQCGRG
ncbi:MULTISPECIES: hypothetical protein [Xanthomonas]|uniref:hypothetical protein n=1 Tax=Xanthomonas TaxID=338 RepID=UPI0012902815|nr:MULTISPECIES: hypothetical protein [Xanthomonas]